MRKNAGMNVTVMDAVIEAQGVALQSLWNGINAGSNALSAAIISRSSGPLYKTKGSDALQVQLDFAEIYVAASHCVLDTLVAPAAPEKDSTKIIHIVTEIDAILARIPERCAPLGELINLVRRRTGYDRWRIRQVIRRNYRTLGLIVR